MKTGMDFDSRLREDLRGALAWAIAFGILIMLAGLLAIIRPYFAAIAAAILVGWIFFFSGFFRLVYAIQTSKEGRFVFKLLASLLYLVAGISLIFRPINGSFIIALLVGIAIALKGCLQVILALQVRPRSGWFWMLISGLAGIILGIFIWSQGALTSAIVLGLLFGLELFFDGLSITLFAWGGRKALE